MSEPAFPIKTGGYGGLTKREWFAGMAMQVAHASTRGPTPASEVARVAFAIADAMIEAGKETP